MSTLRLSYRLPLSTRIISTINSIARFLRIVGRSYSSPADAEEFGPLKFGFRDIESYRDQLYLIYTDPNLNHLEFGRWRVSEVCTYKSNRTTALKHEYFLVATLRDENDSEIFLYFEHQIPKGYLGTGKGKGSVVKADTPNQNNLSEQEEEMGNTWDSKDRTLPLSSLPATHHIQFAANDRVPLPQLIVLACTVNQYLTTGRLAHDSCYLFCFVMLEMLNQLSQHIPSDMQQDHWLGLPGSKIFKNVDFDNLSDSYKKSWENFIKKVDMTINNPNSRDALEAKRLAEEERQRAEREMERADEQARLAKDLERRVAELKAMLPQHDEIIND